jgi:hypothetical protein
MKKIAIYALAAIAAAAGITLIVCKGGEKGEKPRLAPKQWWRHLQGMLQLESSARLWRYAIRHL